MHVGVSWRDSEHAVQVGTVPSNVIATIIHSSSSGSSGSSSNNSSSSIGSSISSGSNSGDTVCLILIKLSPRLCPSTAEHSPPLMPSIVFCLLLSFSRRFLAMSSCHLLLGRPLDLFPLLGCHSPIVLHSCQYPAHFHFCFSVCSITSVIFVLFLILPLPPPPLPQSFDCNSIHSLEKFLSEVSTLNSFFIVSFSVTNAVVVVVVIIIIVSKQLHVENAEK